jgi:hypothetical protein
MRSNCILILILATAAFLSAPHANAQQPQSKPEQGMAGMPGMNMPGMDDSADQNPDAARSATGAMSSREMHMGAHMFMTDLRPENANDDRRAVEIVDTLRESISKYRDYKVALADGFKIFLPNVPQPLYHFTNYRYAYEASLSFDPARPTSLLYKKTSDGYELEGAMYTAPRNATLDQLNERVPLSVSRWHKHVNFCLPPKGTPWRQADWGKFGLGSISTQDACAEANGIWIPQVFGWMVHVYPFEKDPSSIWAVEPEDSKR